MLVAVRGQVLSACWRLGPAQATVTSTDRRRRAILKRGSGWELLRQTPACLEFRRTGKERIVIDLEPNGTRATTMIVHGRAQRSVRRQFAKLASQ
jgi:hypothetical protein